jgi:tRNA G37 N-methylase Trm5
MTMFTPLSQDEHQALDIGVPAAKEHPGVLELIELFRPVILNHLRQAHDCLGLIIKNVEAGAAGATGAVMHGYGIQHNENMKEAEDLMQLLSTLVLEFLKDEQ